jgi:hypothetical protein
MTNMNFKKMIIACATVVLGLASCERQDSNAFTTGEETSMKLHVLFPDQATRAAVDPNATEDEITVSTIDVFVFNANDGKLENRVKLDAQDFDKDPSDDAYNSKASVEIRATVGPKLFAVGINLPNNFPTISSSGQLQQAWAAGLNDLVNANGIVMFSTQLETGTLVAKNDPDYATKNTIKTSVERTVAKVTVQEAGFPTVTTDGTISDVKFAIRNSNKQLFPVQVVVNNIVKDPNWLTSSYVSTDYEDFSDYEAINDQSNTDKLSWNAKYVPENTSEKAFEKMSTYASIRVKFTPSVYSDANGDPTAHTSGSDDFWVVSVNGLVYYFDTKSFAEDFALAKGASVSEKYENGLCYYNAFVNVKNACNTIRNAFYNLKITQIIPPGSATPDVKNPDDKVVEPTNINVTIDIEEWNYLEDEYALS